MKKICLFLLLFSCSLHAGDTGQEGEKKPEPFFRYSAIAATSLGALSLLLHMKGKTSLAENLGIGSLFATTLAFYSFPQSTRFGKFISSKWGVVIPAAAIVFLLQKDIYLLAISSLRKDLKDIYLLGMSSLRKDLIKYLQSFDK